jgi:hypothetical protein
MPPDHNQQHPRRPHYHRGRRGPDRRPGDRRPQQQSQQQQTETTGRDQLDVEQIMREIRSRISERHGIELTAQQIQDLAAHRLEAILDPRAIKPSLMDELRRAAGVPPDAPPASGEPEGVLDEPALYATDSGFVRFMRRLLNPLLKLLFNPGAIVDAINGESRKAAAAAARETELRRRQTEWNALHYEILRRLVTDIVRTEIDNQQLAQRVEALAAKVDFNERRVRGFEQAQHQSPPRPAARPAETPTVSAASTPQRDEVHPSTEHASSDPTSPESGRRRRRRRRGRRSGQPRDLSGAPIAGAAGMPPADQSPDSDDFGDDDAGPDDLIDEAPTVSTMAEEPAVVEEEPPPPPASDAGPRPAEERQQAAPADPDPPLTASASAPPAEPIESAEQPDRVTPEQS